MGILKRRTLIVPGAALTAMQKRRRNPLPFRHLFVGPPSPLMQSKRTKLQQLFCAAKKADAVVEEEAAPEPAAPAAAPAAAMTFGKMLGDEQFDYSSIVGGAMASRE